MKQKKLLKRAKAKTQEKNKSLHFRGFFGSALLLLIILSIPAKITAKGEAVVYLDPKYKPNPLSADIQLTWDCLDNNNCPQLENPEAVPVLFVHGHQLPPIIDLDPRDDRVFEYTVDLENYQSNWQNPIKIDSSIELPSFKDALKEFNRRNPNSTQIEPYYIALIQGVNRTIENDADEIKEAVELILKRHDPNYVENSPSSTTKKVAIIAVSKGTISTRLYLKFLMPKENGIYPISEFIAIAPPNHGTWAYTEFIESGFCGKNNIAFKQLNNGYNENCERFDGDVNCQESPVCNFIERLNGHPLRNTWNGQSVSFFSPADKNLCENGDQKEPFLYPQEAPCSRGNGEPVEKGILYVTLYSKGNKDSIGGHTLSDDCMGRVLARNLAPDAVNLQVPGISGDEDNYPAIPGTLKYHIKCFWEANEEVKSKIAVHANTPHMPEVICKALYTVIYHEAPPDELPFNRTGNNWYDVPLIPDRVTSPATRVVLLFDTSGSMSWTHNGNRQAPPYEQRLDLVKNAVDPFLIMLFDFNESIAQTGMAIFPYQPLAGCKGQLITPLTTVKTNRKDDARRTVRCLRAMGATPLLAGIDRAIEMFGNQQNQGNEEKRAIILLSDGYHNCPQRVDPSDNPVKDIIGSLIARGIKVYAIGFGTETEIDHDLLGRIATDTYGEFKSVTKPGNAANAISSAYKDHLIKALDLQAGADPMGVITGGATITKEVKINTLDRKICFFLSWATPRQGRLELALKASDEIDVPTDGRGVSVNQGDTYRIITVDKSFLEQPGKVGTNPWTIEIKPSGLGAGESENYQYSVIMQSDLEMKTSFDKTSYRTGDIITITAKIKTAGQRVKGLKNVKVTVTRPGDGIGNWYAANKITTRQLDSIPVKIGDENISPAHRKAIYLTDKLEISLPPRTDPNTFYMNDDGKDGDAKANDGIYTIQYGDAIKEGTYSFYIQAAGNDDSADSFEREEMVQKYITVNADPEYSPIDVKIIKTSRSKDFFDYNYDYNVIVIPKDRFGNFMRPGRTVSARIVSKQIGRDPIKLIDNLDGTYSSETSTLSQDEIDEGARLVIEFGGKTFTTIERLPGAGRWSFSMHAGAAAPTGNLNYNYNRGLSLGLNLDYRPSRRFSLVGLLGHNRFKSVSPLIDDIYWWNISLNLKYKFRLRIIPLYMNAGPGLYIPGTGSLKPGINAGLGIDFPLAPRLTLELGTDYHRIFTTGIGTEFFVVHAGMILRL